MNMQIMPDWVSPMTRLNQAYLFALQISVAPSDIPTKAEAAPLTPSGNMFKKYKKLIIIA